MERRLGQKSISLRGNKMKRAITICALLFHANSTPCNPRARNANYFPMASKDVSRSGRTNAKRKTSRFWKALCLKVRLTRCLGLDRLGHTLFLLCIRLQNGTNPETVTR